MINTISFIKSKDYQFIKDLGQGATGITKLIKDQTIDEEFVCKKYSTYLKSDQNLYYENFVSEIKILYKINHSNIVRIFSYYLYPKNYTGYILMEYINGEHIDKYISSNPSKINDIFIQVINAFKYLEEIKILHRDIRPSNILVTNNGIVKIIDFGFGKPIKKEDDYEKSISLNWHYSTPSDFESLFYNHQTEIYFIGKLFEQLIIENSLENTFKYGKTLEKMVKFNHNLRITSFDDILKDINAEVFNEIGFSPEEKIIYSNFADSITSICAKIKTSAKYNTNLDNITKNLYELTQNSILESYVQNNSLIVSCLINGGFRYKTAPQIQTEHIYSFFNWWKNLNKKSQKIVLNNIWLRLDNIKREDDFNDLPF